MEKPGPLGAVGRENTGVGSRERRSMTALDTHNRSENTHRAGRDAQKRVSSVHIALASRGRSRQ